MRHAVESDRARLESTAARSSEGDVEMSQARDNQKKASRDVGRRNLRWPRTHFSSANFGRQRHMEGRAMRGGRRNFPKAMISPPRAMIMVLTGTRSSIIPKSWFKPVQSTCLQSLWMPWPTRHCACSPASCVAMDDPNSGHCSWNALQLSLPQSRRYSPKQES